MEQNLSLEELEKLLNTGKKYNLKEEFRFNGATLIGTNRVLTIRDLQKMEGKVKGKITVVNVRQKLVSDENQKRLEEEIVYELKRNKQYSRLPTAKKKYVEQTLRNLLSHLDYENYVIGHIKKFSKKLFLHSINVAIKSLIVDSAYQKRHNDGLFDGLKSEIILSGALLHDVGYLAVEQGDYLVNSKRKDIIDHKDFLQHPEQGYELLLSQKDKHRLKPEILRIVREHEERLDGSGFPNGLKGNQIHPYTMVVGLCNEFENLLSGELSDSEKNFEQVSRKIMAMKDKFDKNLINNLIEEFRYMIEY